RAEAWAGTGVGRLGAGPPASAIEPSRDEPEHERDESVAELTEHGLSFFGAIRGGKRGRSGAEVEHGQGREHGEDDGDRQDEDNDGDQRSEEHTSELQSRFDLVCRLLLEKKK